MDGQGRALWTSVAALAATLVILLLAFVGHLYDQGRQKDANERAALEAESAVELRIANVSTQLAILGDSIEATSGDAQAFEAASQTILADPAISGVSQTLRITDAERRAFERKNDTTLKEIGPDGELVEASPTDVYYVISQVASQDGRSSSSIGVNVGADPVRRAAIDATMITGQPTLTAPVSLIDSKDPGALIYAPVANLDGGQIDSFAVGIYDLMALTDSIASTVPDDTRLSVMDGDEVVVAGDVPAGAASREVSVAGRTWELRVEASSPSGLPLALVLPGLGALVMAVATAIISLARRRDRFELLNRHLEVLADSDELTGLLNRRGFGRELTRKLFECERYGADGALLILDLDGLKAVNDTIGHSKGDEMLVAAANALRDGSRGSDVVGRIGGDEFAVILPRGGQEGARMTAEALLARLGDKVRPTDGSPLTASVGIAVFANLAVYTPEAALNAADLAMYEAKRAGGHGVGLWAGVPDPEGNTPRS